MKIPIEQLNYFIPKSNLHYHKCVYKLSFDGVYWHMKFSHTLDGSEYSGSGYFCIPNTDKNIVLENLMPLYEYIFP